jgi:hypothetical protein
MYWGAFEIAWVLIFALFTILIWLLNFFDFFSNESCFGVFLFICVSLCAPGAYYLLSTYLDFTPPVVHMGELLSEEGGTLTKIDRDVSKLRRKTDNLENLTIKDAQNLFRDILTFSEKIRQVVGEQKKTISALRVKVEKERKKAEEAKKITNDLKAITKPQFEAITFLLTEDATKQAEKSFIMGMIASFPIGILASLVAVWLTKLFRKKYPHSRS